MHGAGAAAGGAGIGVRMSFDDDDFTPAWEGNELEAGRGGLRRGASGGEDRLRKGHRGGEEDRWRLGAEGGIEETHASQKAASDLHLSDELHLYATFAHPALFEGILSYPSPPAH
jgi:hypothetical protein